MAGDVSTNNIRVGATIDGLIENMKKVSAAVRGTVSDINGNLADSYKRAGKEQAVFSKGLGKLGDDLTSIGTKMSLITTLPALFAAGKSYKDYGELEKLEKGLTRYGETMKGVREIAKLPNIGVFDSAKNLIGLKSMKLSSDLATRSIKAMANAITDAGGSAVDLDPALLNLKQFKATRNINQVDLRQLSARVPQTMDAIQSAFGTMDPEKLNKLGIDKFIEGYITELEKIPMVSGGAANAQEQLSDSFLFLSGSLGKVGDSVFGITDKIKGLTGIMDGMSDSLGTADPTLLKLGLSMAALGIATPVVVTAMGAVVSAGAALAAGLGVAGIAVAGVAAAFVVGGALIITYWDDIKGVLTDVGVWSTLSGLVSSGLDVVVGLFKIVGSILTLNWSDAWKNIKNTLAGSVNFLNTLMFGVVKQVGLLAASIVSFTLMPELGNWIREKSLGLDDLLKKLNIAQLGQPVAKTIAPKPGQQSIVDSDAYGKQFGIRDDNVKYISNAKASITQLTEKLSGLETAYKNLVPTEEGYAAKKADLAKQVRQVTDQITSQNKGLEDAKKKIKETTDAYVEMSKAQLQIWSIDVSMRYAEEQKSLTDKIKSYKELIGVVANLNVERLKGASVKDMQFGGPDLGKLAGPASGMGDTIKKITKKSNSQSSQYDAAEGYQRSKEALKDYYSEAGRLADLNAGIAQSFEDLKNTIGIGLGEALGDAISGVTIDMKNLGAGIYNLIGDLLTNLGKALIAYSSVMKGLIKAISTMNPWVAIGAGVLAIAAGKALKNTASNMGKDATASMPHFAEGAMAYNKMTAVVGDNRNARFDPEMIAPYSKVDASIKKSIRETGGGSSVFIPDITLKGSDIVIAFKRQERTNLALF